MLTPSFDYNFEPFINIKSKVKEVAKATINFSILVRFIDIPFHFDYKPKDLELWRFHAQFYGYYYDRKRTNYVLWTSVGSKKNYGFLMPVFYQSEKRLKNSRRFKAINSKSWFFYSYLFKNSFGYEKKDLNLLERTYDGQINDYESKENSLLCLSDTAAKMQFPSYKFKWLIENNHYEIDHSISVYDAEWKDKNFCSYHFPHTWQNVYDFINNSFLSTSLYINNYENRKLSSPDLYFMYKKVNYFLSRCVVSTNSILSRSKESSSDYNLLYSKYNFMLRESYSLLFRSYSDRFTSESMTRFMNTKYLLYKYYRFREFSDIVQKYLPPKLVKESVSGPYIKSKWVKFNVKVLIRSLERIDIARNRWLRARKNLKFFTLLNSLAIDTICYTQGRAARKLSTFITLYESFLLCSRVRFNEYMPNSECLVSPLAHLIMIFITDIMIKDHFNFVTSILLQLHLFGFKLCDMNKKQNLLYNCDFQETLLFAHTIEQAIIYHHRWKRFRNSIKVALKLRKELIRAWHVHKRLWYVFKMVKRSEIFWLCGLLKKHYKKKGVNFKPNYSRVSRLYKVFRRAYTATPFNYIKYFIYLKQLLNGFITYNLFARKANPFGSNTRHYSYMKSQRDESNWNSLWNKIMLMSNCRNKTYFQSIFFGCRYAPLRDKFAYLRGKQVDLYRCKRDYLKLCQSIGNGFRNASEDLIKSNKAFWFNAYHQKRKW